MNRERGLVNRDEQGEGICEQGQAGMDETSTEAG